MSTLTAKQFAAAINATEELSDAILQLLDLQGYEIRRKAARRGKVDKPAGQAFAETLSAACRAAAADLGPRWDLQPGCSQMITLPARLATYRFRRPDGSLSVPIKAPRDRRAPAARYWPGGAIPDGVYVGAV